MASFEYHVNIAVVTTGILITPIYSAQLLDVNQSLIILSIGLIGGLLPDLDSDNSKPIQIIFKMMSIFLPLLVLISIGENLPILYMIGLWILSTILLQILFFQLFLKLTVHRGIFHSIPMGVVFAQSTVLIFYYTLQQDLVFSTIAGIFLFVGFIVHLLLDELVSVNALGFRMKKSLGTAFKFYDKHNRFGTIALYFIILFLYFVMPAEIETNTYAKLLDLFNNMNFF